MQILFNWLLTKKGKKPDADITDFGDAKRIVAPINTDDKKCQFPLMVMFKMFILLTM